MDTTLSPNPGCPPCTLRPNERLLTICFGRRLQSRIWEQSLTSPDCERHNHFHRMHIAYGSCIWTTSDIDQDFSGPILFNGKKKSIWIQISIGRSQEHEHLLSSTGEIAGRDELSSAGVDLEKLVGEVVPPLVDAWLELLPACKWVGELFEAHSKAAQLVRGHRGGRGERAEGLWGGAGKATLGNIKNF